MADSPKRSQFDYGILRQLGKGASFRSSVHAEAYLRSLISGRTKAEELADISREMQNYESQFEKTALAADLTGALASAAPLMFLPGGQAVAAGNIARTGGTLAKVANKLRGPGGFTGKGMRAIKRGGAGFGGGYVGGDVAGYYSEAADNVTDEEREEIRKQAQRFGGALGSVAGTVAPPVIQKIANVGKRLFKKPNVVDDVAGEQLAKNFPNETVEEVVADIKQKQAMGVPVIPGLATNPLTEQSDTILTKGFDDASPMLRDAIDDTLDSQARITQRLTDINPELLSEGFFEITEKLNKEMIEKSKPLYRRSYYVKGDPKTPRRITDKKVLDFFKRPAFKKALKNAIQLVEDEGGDVTELISLQDKIIKSKSGDITAISVEVADNVKRGIDDVISAQIKDGKISNKGRVINNAKNEFLNEIDKIVPEYAEARAVYSDRISLIDAGNTLRRMWNKSSTKQLEKKLNRFNSDAEKQMAVLGVVDLLQEKILKPDGATNIAKMLGGGTGGKGGVLTREKIRLLFDDDVIKADVFEKVMMLESELYQRGMRAMGGSPTAPRQQKIKDFDKTTESKQLKKIITGPDSLLSKVSKLFTSDSETDAFQDQVALRISELLSDGSPESLATLTTLVNKALKKVEDKGFEDLGGGISTGAVTAYGTTQRTIEPSTNNPVDPNTGESAAEVMENIQEGTYSNDETNSEVIKETNVETTSSAPQSKANKTMLEIQEDTYKEN